MGEMVKTQRLGKSYSDNLIGTSMAFNTTQTWNVSAGTGTCATDNTYAYSGTLSLKLENTDPTVDIVGTYTGQNTVFPLKSESARLAVRLLKNDASYAYTGEIQIFKNAVLLDTQTFTLADTDDLTWVTFVSESKYAFVVNDAITFKIVLDGVAGHGGTTRLWLDGWQLYATTYNADEYPPVYAPPISETVTPSNYSITSDTNAVDGATYYANCTSGNVTVTLPLAANSNNAEITVKRIDASGNDVIIDGNGSETIDGNATVTITDQWNSVTVRCNGTAWFIV